jgi:hypothetical protein
MTLTKASASSSKAFNRARNCACVDGLDYRQVGIFVGAMPRAPPNLNDQALWRKPRVFRDRRPDDCAKRKIHVVYKKAGSARRAVRDARQPPTPCWWRCQRRAGASRDVVRDDGKETEIAVGDPFELRSFAVPSNSSCVHRRPRRSQSISKPCASNTAASELAAASASSPQP